MIRPPIWPAVVEMEMDSRSPVSPRRLRTKPAICAPVAAAGSPRDRALESPPMGRAQGATPSLIRFGTFDADLTTGELRRRGGGVALPDGETVIGRDPDVRLSVDARSVSRRHARIVVSEAGAVIEDLGSKNGTFVNGQRVTVPRTLQDKDEIRVGAAIFVVRAY